MPAAWALKRCELIFGAGSVDYAETENAVRGETSNYAAPWDRRGGSAAKI
jgi:hypothetical protein